MPEEQKPKEVEQALKERDYSKKLPPSIDPDKAQSDTAGSEWSGSRWAGLEWGGRSR